MLPKEPIWERWKIHTFLNIFNYCCIAGQDLGCRRAPLLEHRQSVGFRRSLISNSHSRFHIQKENNLKNLRVCDDFKLNIRVSRGGCHLTDTRRSRLSALKLWRCRKLGGHSRTCAPPLRSSCHWALRKVQVPALVQPPPRLEAPRQDAQQNNLPSKGHKSPAPHPPALRPCLLLPFLRLSSSPA